MKKIKKTYNYAIISAIYLTLLSLTLAALSYLFFYKILGTTTILLFGAIFFMVSILVIQYRAEHFIYQRVKKLYEDISVLNVNDLKKDNITTDLEGLTKHVQNYVEDKKEEIADLTAKDSFRRDFLGNIAHELKTPLFTVQGYILTLIEGAADDKEIRDKYLIRANKGVERLTAIIKDLDMITKLETDGMKLNITTFNILELIQNVFDLFEMKAKKRNIKLLYNKIYEFPLLVKGDLERIEQVLLNLVDNSIKYGKIGGITKISVENYNNHKLIIKVSDNGEGIKQEHLPRLFERFYRVDHSRSREQGGSGLGLSIVKHIVEAHNETISLQSNFGEGSEFSFTLDNGTTI